MKVWTREADYNLGASVVALGTFDGVHIGHQALIRRAMALARELEAACVVCTFDRHPLSLLCPERMPMPLTTVEERLEKLESMGVDGVLLKPFTRAFADMEAENYLECLVERLHARGVVAGFNFSFGAGGRGDAQLIRSLAPRLGYRAEIVEAVRDGGDTVSSTLIRALLKSGDSARAAALMALTPENMGK